MMFECILLMNVFVERLFRFRLCRVYDVILMWRGLVVLVLIMCFLYVCLSGSFVDLMNLLVWWLFMKVMLVVVLVVKFSSVEWCICVL